jgi:mRNA guanylyltransferase
LGNNSSKPDFHAKPVFLLHVWTGGEGNQAKYEEYDEMYVDDDEWEKCVSPLHLTNCSSQFHRLKLTGEQIDDRIVEVHWEPDHSRWRMMRFRDDKPNANHISTVEKVIQSIVDGVEKDAVRFLSFHLQPLPNP